MEAARYYFGFGERILDGGISVTVTNDGAGASGSANATSAEEFFHGTLSDVGGNPAGNFVGFATWLEARLNLIGAATWTVTWSNATLGYTIANNSGGNITLVLSTWARRLLGFEANPAPANPVTSAVRPWFVIAPYIGAVAKDNDRERAGAFSEGITDGGRGYMVGPTTIATDQRWEQQHETYEATQDYAAVALVPFTWRHAFRWCRGYVPFLLVRSTSASIAYGTADVVGRFKMTADGATWNARRTDGRTNARWTIPFAARCIERVSA